MAELTEEQKLEIVTRLAQYEAIAEVVADFRSRGIETEHKQIGSYDPTKSYFEGADKWREIFEAVRKAYRQDIAAVPIADQVFRLNELLVLYARAKSKNQTTVAAALLEQAAREAGGTFTNQRELSVSDSRRPKARDLEPEDRQAMMADIIRKVIEDMPPVPTVQ